MRQSNPCFKKTNIYLALTIGLLTSFSALLIGCADDDESEDATTDLSGEVVISTATLIDDPVAVHTYSAAELTQAARDAGVSTSLVADPICGVTVYHINHTTEGLKGEATNATGAVMAPNGDAPECQGDRPVTLYAHGTTPFKSYNLSAINDPANPAQLTALYLATYFAGRGDIVIAPNYPGYDTSTLTYAPYVTYQQGQQMLDGLHAGRLAVDRVNNQSGLLGSSKEVATSDTHPMVSDKVFITGYSQGGYVAMAAAKALDDLGAPATAVSPASGPYAITAFADSIMSGPSDLWRQYIFAYAH